jgi:2-hydroxychromene-2-carboxylate isomerase
MLATEVGAELVWRPILVGGVFNRSTRASTSSAQPVPTKLHYAIKDWGLGANLRPTIGAPPVFPVNSAKAMRGAFVAAEHGKLPAYCRKVFETMARPQTSHRTTSWPARRCGGLDRDEYFTKIATPEYKGKLRANTDELITRGGFGSPTMFIDGEDMYFGNDRLVLVRDAVLRAREAEAGS